MNDKMCWIIWTCAWPLTYTLIYVLYALEHKLGDIPYKQADVDGTAVLFFFGMWLLGMFVCLKN